MPTNSGFFMAFRVRQTLFSSRAFQGTARTCTPLEVTTPFSTIVLYIANPPLIFLGQLHVLGNSAPQATEVKDETMPPNHNYTGVWERQVDAARGLEARLLRDTDGCYQ